MEFYMPKNAASHLILVVTASLPTITWLGPQPASLHNVVFWSDLVCCPCPSVMYVCLFVCLFDLGFRLFGHRAYLYWGLWVIWLLPHPASLHNVAFCPDFRYSWHDYGYSRHHCTTLYFVRISSVVLLLSVYLFVWFRAQALCQII